MRTETEYAQFLFPDFASQLIRDERNDAAQHSQQEYQTNAKHSVTFRFLSKDDFRFHTDTLSRLNAGILCFTFPVSGCSDLLSNLLSNLLFSAK